MKIAESCLSSLQGSYTKWKKLRKIFCILFLSAFLEGTFFQQKKQQDVFIFWLSPLSGLLLPLFSQVFAGPRSLVGWQSWYEQKMLARAFSHRAEDSAVSDWNVGEPPIDEKHTERGEKPASHLGKETNTREMLLTLARESEERLLHERGNKKDDEESLTGRMIREEEGKSVWALGMRVTVKCPGQMTGGVSCLMEYILAPGDGSETHIHAREDETWYLLEGEMEWKLGDQTYEAKKGSYIFLPKDVPHSFHNRSMEPARMLVSCVPAGFENYFLEIGVPFDPQEATKPETTSQDRRNATHAGRKYGVVFTPQQSTHN